MHIGSMIKSSERNAIQKMHTVSKTQNVIAVGYKIVVLVPPEKDDENDTAMIWFVCLHGK